MWARKCICGLLNVNLTLQEDQIKFNQILLKWLIYETFHHDNT
jgi:hypothetical protein